MKIRVSNLPRVLNKDHYENKGVKDCLYKDTMKITMKMSNLHPVL